MLSPYRYKPNNTKKRSKKAKNTDFDNKSDRKAAVRRPQMTSNDFKSIQTKSNKKNKNVPKAGSVQENIEINEHCLDEILQKNNC